MNRKPQMINIVMIGGKKDKKDKDSIKDKTKKKMYKPNVHQFEKLLCLFSDIKQF